MWQKSGTLFAIMDAFATSVAANEWKLYRKAKIGRTEDRVEVTRHAALDMWNKPNNFYSQADFVEAGQQHYELVGEHVWLIVKAGESETSMPLEMWIIRPDRIFPVPNRDNFLAGWVYKGPDGEKIPLRVDEVIQTKRQNPEDPYRGASPVSSISSDIESAALAAEWNRNFFENSAEPGGIIEVDKRLGDDQFAEMVMRWNQQHKGVSRAHRVAVLEEGKWIDRKFTNKDMQFTELRNLPRDIIREAFRFPTHMLGSSETVNRAVAEAQEYVYSKHLIVPRLDKWKDTLNSRFLPMFGATDVEFDYTSPVPDDVLSDSTANANKATAVATLTAAGADWDETLAWLGLPPIPRKEPAPAPAPEPPAMPAPIPPGTDASFRGGPARGLRAEADLDPSDLPDISHVQTSWEDALNDLLSTWAGISDAQKAELVELVRTAAESGDIEGLSNLQLAADDGGDALKAAMVALASSAARQVETEADAQGATVTPTQPAASLLGLIAAAVAALLGRELAISASREALRVMGPTSKAKDVADAVEKHLGELTDAKPNLFLGSALTDAQHMARVATINTGTQGAFYASEVLDKNTCGPCRTVNGRWLGNTTGPGGAYAPMIDETYPVGGYVDCKGRQRCRGMVVGVWRKGDEK
jgi:HK97 family phage portal protein